MLRLHLSAIVRKRNDSEIFIWYSEKMFNASLSVLMCTHCNIGGGLIRLCSAALKIHNIYVIANISARQRRSPSKMARHIYISHWIL